MRHPVNLYGLPRLEDALQYIFFLSLFQGGTAQIPGMEITGLPIRKDGISLQCLTTRSEERRGQTLIQFNV